MSSFQSHEFLAQKTARFYTSGSLEKQYKHICFCLHGYGQLAEFFLEKFTHSSLQHILFVAPEGFHRFYLKGTSKRVGASWMTKEDRLNDIKDYTRFLTEVRAHVMKHQKNVNTTGVFGFSQGVATACRWVAESNHAFDYLINWAGAFPPDLDFEAAHHKMKPMKLIMACGDNDEFISEEKLVSHLSFLKEHNFDPEIIRFEGGHNIYKKPLLQAFEQVV